MAANLCWGPQIRQEITVMGRQAEKNIDENYPTTVYTTEETKDSSEDQ